MEWVPGAIEAVRLILDLLQEARRVKDTANKLNTLARSWEQTVEYKDILLRLYEEESVNDENRQKVREIREDLYELQRLLRLVRFKVTREEDAGADLFAAEELARKILGRLVLF